MFEWFDLQSGVSFKDLDDMKRRLIKKIADLEATGVRWGRRIGIDDGKDDAFFRFMREKI
ncbi:uncharacterized protein LOC110178110 [Drosophila serrata]|uniref:uncharacterized protein LOC110178110 n=1 Tax=Drosophila serrata TaxID=7274 RepID=UPI000A1D2262|nr:uncharacterized protein LOC110178110 [Drosophila serrata]